MTSSTMPQRHSTRRRRLLVGAGLILLVALGTFALVRGREPAEGLVAVAKRADITVALVETGILRPAESITYRSPLVGRDAELTFLTPEGTYVEEGDLLARLDAAELTRELERALDTTRQAEVGVAVAAAQREDAIADVESVTEGERALEIEEAKAKLLLTEKKVARLQEDYDGLKPLLAKGFITREELDRSALDLEQAQTELGLMRKRVNLLTGKAQPREEQRARLQLAQRNAQLANSQLQAKEVAALVASLKGAINACSIYARHAGLVVHEEFIGATPRRKVRVGDRVSAIQGLVTIPEVQKMLLDTSVREADLWRVRIGQAATITVDAFPALKLTGRIIAVGTLGRGALDRPFDGKRFDITIALDGTNRDLRPDMTSRARIAVAERRQVITVPAAAVSRRGDVWFVTLVRAIGSADRQVRLGESDDALVEIVDGLSEGDRVSLTGSGAARTGG
jgi:HlyD family secretion protein